MPPYNAVKAQNDFYEEHSTTMSVTEQATAAGVKITGIDLTAYLVRDPEKATAFYRDVLGMTPTEIDEEGRGAEFTFEDGSTFGVWKPEDGETGGAIMFKVADAHAAVPYYRAKGLALSDVVESSVCLMAFGQDPEGNAIIIHQRKVKD
jgi:catechol 2,3-dioxygenase-like lactoylglutathione lyase family enzyme